MDCLPLNEASVPDIAAAYRGTCVAVTGAGGTIGAEVCRQLLECHPAKIILFELSEPALYTVHKDLSLRAKELGTVLVPVLGSAGDPVLALRILSGHRADTVLHAAAYKHVPLVEQNPLAGMANNALGTWTLLRAAACCSVSRFVLVSSDKAVRPANAMGVSKRLAELFVLDQAARSGSRCCIARSGNVLGSSGSVLPLFQEQAARGGPVTVTDPRMKRYFLPVAAAGRLVLAAGADAEGGEVFVPDMGQPLPVLQLARNVIADAERNGAGRHGSGIAIEFSGKRPGEKLEEELSLTGRLLPTRRPGVLRAAENVSRSDGIETAVRRLRKAVAEGDEAAALAVAACWVEGSARSKSSVA